MINDIKRVRDHTYSVSRSFADKVEYSFTQVLALGSGAAAVLFVAYIGLASIWAIVQSI